MRKSRIPTFSRAADALADLVFPRECPLTGGLPEDASGFRHLSPAAVRDLPLIRPPCCKTCGAPFYGLLAGPQDCVHCRELEPEFESGRAILVAGGRGRALIHEFKYHGGMRFADDLARLATLTPGYLERLRGAVLVPVPLHPRKLRERGFNQSLLFAGALARLVEGAVVSELLLRLRDTGSQTRLDRAARLANTQKAFAIRSGAPIKADLSHVVIDDVFTTGATLNACSSALREAGIRRVLVATLGHG